MTEITYPDFSLMKENFLFLQKRNNKMTDDIFDIRNTDDLPEQLQEAVKKEFDNNIIELFKIAGRPLHINEVTVAYYRKYGIEKTKRQITIKLCNMSRHINPKIIKYNKKGYYRLVDFKRWEG